MTLTAENLATLEIIVRIGATLTILGSSAVLYDVYRNWATIRKTPNRMTLYWCIAALFPAPALLIGRSQLPPTPISPPNGLCLFQALTISYGFLGSSIWAAAMATNVWLVSARAWPMKRILKMERYHHMVAWGVPLLVSLVPLALKDGQGREPFYGNATLWCWISNSYAPYRLILFFGPLWVVFAFCICVYAHTGWIIRATFKDTLSPVNCTSAKKHIRGQIRVRAWFAIKCGLFLLSFFASYIGGTTNRIANFFLTSPSYPLFLFHVLTIPSAGMFNAIGYFGAIMLTRYLRTARRQGGSKAKSASVKWKRNESSAQGLLRRGQMKVARATGPETPATMLATNAESPTSSGKAVVGYYDPSSNPPAVAGLEALKSGLPKSGRAATHNSSFTSQAGGGGAGTGAYEPEIGLGSWGGLDVPSGFLHDEFGESSSRMGQGSQTSKQQDSLGSKPVN